MWNEAQSLWSSKKNVQLEKAKYEDSDINLHLKTLIIVILLIPFSTKAAENVLLSMQQACYF